MHDRYPWTLVIARHGKVIHRFSGLPFVWLWSFEQNGARVAYEAGPLHGVTTCMLADVASGRRLGSYKDCMDESTVEPEWVKKMNDAERKRMSQ